MSTVNTVEYRDEIAELLADFTANVSGDIDSNIREAAKRALSDSVAVGLGALDHPASHIARKFAAPFATPNGAVIWGTGMRAHPDLAGFVNGSLLRCYDYNDFYVGDRNSGHPSDMAAGLISVAEWVGAVIYCFVFRYIIYMQNKIVNKRWKKCPCFVIFMFCETVVFDTVLLRQPVSVGCMSLLCNKVA